MRSQSGVSLVEVLVATVLLAVGINGTLAAVAAAQRLQRDARARDALASLALDRLDWFAHRACGLSDSLGQDSARAIRATWQLRDSASTRRLQWQGRSTGDTRHPLRVDAEWSCP